MTRPAVLLLGNPNSGKTTLFNALTGLSARVGNYPGITVDHREGRALLPQPDGSTLPVDVVDVPGTYSLLPRSDDETVAVRALFGDLPRAAGDGARAATVVVAVVDATQLQRNLHLVAQLRELPLPLVLALTMTDTVAADGRAVDVDALARRIGVPVVSAPAVRGGADALRALLGRLCAAPTSPLPMNAAVPSLPPSSTLLAAIDAAGRAAAEANGMDAPRALGLLVAQAVAVDGLGRLPPVLRGRAVAAAADALVGQHGLSALLRDVVTARWERAGAWADGVIASSSSSSSSSQPSSLPSSSSRPAADEAPSARLTRRIDAVALHPVLGPVLLVGVFLALFQALFAGAEPLMDVVEGVVAAAGAFVGAWVPSSLPLLQSLLVEGVVAGVGNVVVFVPQIAILFLFLGVLDDSGYLARAAFLLDRVMRAVGLHGRAFVPLLSGFACAVPAIMATRTIESTKDRLVTVLVTPLISCSARLPVYALMIATVFASTPPLWGVWSAGAVVMVALYTLSLLAAVVMAAIFKRTLLRSPTPPLVLELPPWRRPRAGQVARAVAGRVRTFLVEAGTVILACTVVLWAVLKFPVDERVAAARDAAVAAVVAEQPAGADRDARVAAIHADARKRLVEHSAAGRLGHLLEPVLAPLGFDWKIGIGLIASFAAREVFVSTLGIVYGLGDEADESSVDLREAMRSDTRADGTPLYTPLTALSLMVFFVLAMQCMSTLAAVKRETRSWRWPLFQLGYMTALAWGAAFVVHQVGRLLGFA
jgi:ferrous iron transport protein B